MNFGGCKRCRACLSHAVENLYDQIILLRALNEFIALPEWLASVLVQGNADMLVWLPFYHADATEVLC